MPTGEILIEIQRVGSILRICAVDPIDGTEVVFQAPTAASKEDIRKLAINKLNYIQNKAKRPTADGKDDKA